MAIAVQSTTGSDFSTTANKVLNKPTGTIDGDLLIAILAVRNSEDLYTPPAGWTTEETITNFDVGSLALYWKVASSEGSSWTWTNGNARSISGIVLRVDGQDPSGSADQSNSAVVSNTASPSFANTITPSRADSLIVMAVACTQASGGISSHAITTNNPSWTEHYDYMNLSVATAIRPETSATGNSSASLTGGGGTTDSLGLLVSFKKDPNINVSVGVIDMPMSVFSPTIIGDAVISPSVIDMPMTPITPTVTEVRSIWENENKSSPGAITNTPKS